MFWVRPNLLQFQHVDYTSNLLHKNRVLWFLIIIHWHRHIWQLETLLPSRSKSITFFKKYSTHPHTLWSKRIYPLGITKINEGENFSVCCIHSILEKLKANFCMDRAQSYWLCSRGSCYSSGMQRLEVLCKCCFHSSRQQTLTHCIFKEPNSNGLHNTPLQCPIHTQGITAIPGHYITSKRDHKRKHFNKHTEHTAPLNHLYQKLYKQCLQSS